MTFHSSTNRVSAGLCTLALSMLAATPTASRSQEPAAAQQPRGSFGGAYSGLDSRRQRLVDDWVARFNDVTGQNAEAESFYDTFVRFSTKTTFDAVTNALMTTPLTDASGARFGDALDLLERVESVRGQVEGASGDRQFRMYATLKEAALDMLDRSREFSRATDNTVYHKGYPISYRQQGGTPSIQVSIALDGRRADIDVDYRSSSFPVGLFNGHLSSSNSDVRAGNNYDRHANRWAGFQNWWRSFFGIRLEHAPEDTVADPTLQIPREPRAGRKTIDVMMNDFLSAWLLEGDVIAAMGYISERSYACLAQEGDDPFAFDRGMAPFQLLIRMKAAHDAVGKRESLEGLTVGVNLAIPDLKLVDHPQHAQFVLYSVPDDVATEFDCESRLTLGDPGDVRREYGNYFGATFYVNTPRGRDNSLALLWGEEKGYWKIVSWRSDPIEEDIPELATAPDVQVLRLEADPTFADAARDFLESWLIRKDYDAAFRYLSSKSYACYDVLRSPDERAAESLDDAGRRIRGNLERAGERVGEVRSLDALLAATEPLHPAVRVLDHPHSRTFALTSLPNAIARASDCAARARGERFTGEVPLEYGSAFGMNIRFKMRRGDAPVLRMLWLEENDLWRIAAYDVEVP
jgi:hypothetical protein